MAGKSKEFAKVMLGAAGITINGNQPWDIVVHDESLYDRIMRYGSIGLGEAYVDGLWDVSRLDEFFTRILSADLDRVARKNWQTLLLSWTSAWFNQQSKTKARIVGQHHYDLGNDLFIAMLDKSLTYTCGYWQASDNLEDAQTAKLDLVCRKLDIKKNEKVLDIGCGWGSFAKYASEKYKSSVIGVTISREQVALGRKLCAGLPVKILFEDYRDIKGEYDNIVSLGMFEHVGYKNYRDYMRIVHDKLKNQGLFLLHTIGWSESVTNTDPWIEKYIFPNSMLPSIAQIGTAAEGLFVMEDWHNFGADYDKTLMAWLENFQSNWPKLADSYDERFYRMWKYFLCVSAGSFRSRKSQLWQIVFSKKGVAGGYRPIR